MHRGADSVIGILENYQWPHPIIKKLFSLSQGEWAKWPLSEGGAVIFNWLDLRLVVTRAAVHSCV